MVTNYVHVDWLILSAWKLPPNGDIDYIDYIDLMLSY